MSADELQNALIVGPNAKEQDWFRDRAQYDLVVYHDQSTTDTSYLKSQMGSHALQTLHLALTDFDCCVTLRRSPLLLAGGLDAWVDLYGPASLAITAAEEAKEPLPGTKPKLFRQSREVTRAPTPHLLERRAGQPHAPPPYPTSTHGSAQRLLAMPAEPTRTTIEEEKKRVGSLQEAPLSVSVPAGTEDGKQGTSTVATIVPYARTVEEFVGEESGLLRGLNYTDRISSSDNIKQVIPKKTWELPTFPRPSTPSSTIHSMFSLM